MDRFTVLVDAGYLLAAGALVTIGSDTRADARVDIPALLRWLRSDAGRSFEGRELLRLYWYDGAANKLPTSEHIVVSDQEDTKLRLGHLSHNSQKGVDALILSDMTDLARCGAVTDVVLIAGDGDHEPAVERAQALGVRVHVWAVNTPENSLSAELRRCADVVRILEPNELRAFISKAPPPPTERPSWMAESAAPSPARSHSSSVPVYSSVSSEDAFDSGLRFGRNWCQRATAAQRQEMTKTRPSIPADIDRQLLWAGIHDLELPERAELNFEARVQLRDGFWAAIDEVADRAEPGSP